LQVLRKAIASDPTDAVAHLYLGIALTRTGDPDAGLESFRRVLALDPASERAHMYAATILLVRGRDEEAAAHMRGALESHPDFVPAHLALAQTLQRLGDQKQSQQHYARAVELDPGNAEARLGRAFTLIALGRHREARDALEADIEIFPDEGAFQHARARLLAASPDAGVRDGRRALEAAERLAKQMPSLGLGETIGMALAETGQHGQAVAWQLQLIQAAQEQGTPAAILERLRRNLKLYRDAEACREPWAPDDPVFHPPRPESA
jgi:superkiller protein 3